MPSALVAEKSVAIVGVAPPPDLVAQKSVGNWVAMKSVATARRAIRTDCA
jgi:hypothetical protein